MALYVKVCGLVDEASVRAALDAGADAIGLNFVPSSSRRVDVARARELAALARGRLRIVGVIADMDPVQALELAAVVGLDALQLHGRESPAAVAEIAAHVPAYKAVRVGDRDDLDMAARYAGELLVDAKVPGVLGGSGAIGDWALAAEIAASRRVILAGGLHPGNVAEAVRGVRPAGVDVASGVEPNSTGARAPGHKDPELTLAFVAAARAAATSGASG
jgi:phosphoribosylanthranilate isomerase